MLQSLFRRAEASVDNAIAGVLGRVLIAIPFIAAAAFATASATIYLNSELGPAGGTFAMAVLFVVIGGVTAWIVSSRMQQPASAAAASVASSAPRPDAVDATAPMIDSADKELLGDVAKSLVPLAIPAVLRLAVRNLPLIAAAAAASFILSRRNSETTAAAPPVMQPAE